MSLTIVNGASVWLVLVKVSAISGECRSPTALVAQAIGSQRIIEIDLPRLKGVTHPPYPTGAQTLLVTIDACAVAACHLALGWRMPERIIDLLVEFRNVTNGIPNLIGSGLAGALISFGRRPTGALTEGSSPKQMLRRLAALAELFEAMRDEFDAGQAMLRGRYLCTVARMEEAGIPVDRETIERLSQSWPTIKRRVIDAVDHDFGIYRGHKLDPDALSRWLDDRGINWPRNQRGQLDLSDDLFRDMARVRPELRTLKELRTTLIGFDPSALTVGHDCRNRTPLRPFSSKTGRNQPSSKASILGTAAWVRHLIVAPAGTGLALIDWQQQEFGIAAALSGDQRMQQAYNRGDPYIDLAIEAGAAPTAATATTHPQIRERYKACALGIQFGMGAARLAHQISLREIDAIELLRHHRAAFPKFWSWCDGVETRAMLHRGLQSVFGWRIRVGSDANPRSLRNFPMQANGAEMLRLSCCLASESGIKICAPNHDALLIEAPLTELDDAIATTRRLMAEASATVLDGFALRTSVRSVEAPQRWAEPKGQAVWSAVNTALAEVTARQRDGTCSRTDARTMLLSVYKRGI